MTLQRQFRQRERGTAAPALSKATSAFGDRPFPPATTRGLPRSVPAVPLAPSLMPVQPVQGLAQGTVAQRVYLDNQDTLEADLSSQDREAARTILAAMKRYRDLDEVLGETMSADRSVDIEPLQRELVDLVGLIDTLTGRGTPRLVAILSRLKTEAELVAEDLGFYAEMERNLASEDWQRDPDNIFKAGQAILLRYGKYQVTWRARENATIYRGLTRLERQRKELEARWENEWAVDRQEGYRWGDKSGRLSAKDREMLADFRALKAFMDNKSLVLTHLLPLATTIRDSPDKLSALKAALRVKERSAGFDDPPQIPLGILPSEVFFDLLRKGQMLDDYGAGLKHGELTHRLQWYAVIDAVGSDLTLNGTPNELYRLMGREPRSGDPAWGEIFDQGNEVNSGSYSSPATLNRDLVESTGATEGPGLPRRERYETPREASVLTSIGAAITQLRERRLTQASGARDRGADFQEEAFPPPSRVEALEGEMRENPELFALTEEDYVGNEFMAQRSRYAVWRQLGEQGTDSLSWGISSWPAPWKIAAGLGAAFVFALFIYNRRR